MKPTSKVASWHKAEQREVRPIKRSRKKKKIQIVIYYKAEETSRCSQWSAAAVKANSRELWGRDICCKRRRYPRMNLKWKLRNGLDLTNKKGSHLKREIRECIIRDHQKALKTINNQSAIWACRINDQQIKYKWTHFFSTQKFSEINFQQLLNNNSWRLRIKRFCKHLVVLKPTQVKPVRRRKMKKIYCKRRGLQSHAQNGYKMPKL